MTAGALRVVFAAALLAAVAAGCAIGPGGQGSGESTLTVTRDFGARAILHASERQLPAAETVMRLLQRRARVETRYEGRFVNAINGLRSSSEGSRQADWFYYVNGIEADVGAAEKRVHSGDRVWWDYRDWSAAMRVPAVVGSFPEPFLHGSDGKRFPVRIDCASNAADACREVAARLDKAGIAPSTAALGAVAGKELLRFVVGEWADVRADAAARQVEQGPGVSGVFARIGPGPEGPELLLLDRVGRVAKRLASAGLVAATRFEQQQPTWIVTGTNASGLESATRLLSERELRDRFAVAAEGGRALALPLPNAGGESKDRDGGA
jgi:hypothetical protein